MRTEPLHWHTLVSAALHHRYQSTVVGVEIHSLGEACCRNCSLEPAENKEDQIPLPLKFNGSFGNSLLSEFDVALNGPFTIVLPSGITLVDLKSEQGNIQSVMVDGRQEITYNVPAGDVDDTITFQVHLSWLYFLVQFWKYPAIILILLLLYVRRRRKKRQKRKLRRAQTASAAKPMLGDSEFADPVSYTHLTLPTILLV